MTKKEYLRQLEEEIVLIDEDIADDIIEYYKLRFEEGKRFESKTVEEIILELGEPKELAKRIYGSYDIREDLWESAREDEVQMKKVLPVILFDLLVGTWLIPLLVFLTLTGFASFVTFPFVIAAIPGLVIRDALLVILLAIGTYSILLLLVLGLTEVGIVVIKNILIWNLKVLSPKNKTTSRMIKRVSLFHWMRQVKMGRNIFINLGMVAISIISISFILLSNFNSEVFGIFDTQPVLSQESSRDLSQEIIDGEVYSIFIDVGNVDVQLVENLSDELLVTHKYNFEDGFSVIVDTERNMINIYTYQDQVNEGFLNNYAASIRVSIPEDLLVDIVNIKTLEGDIDVLNYEVNKITVNNQLGDVHFYDLEADTAVITTDEGSVTLISGFYEEITVASTDAYITINDVNNMLNDGTKIKISSFKGTVNLNNTYFKAFDIDTNSADVFIANENEIYIIQSMKVNSNEGEVVINAPYIEE